MNQLPFNPRASATQNPTTDDRRRWTRAAQQLAGPMLLVLVGCALLTIDVPVARWIKQKNLPGELRELLDLAEVFGHGVGAAAILLAAWALAPLARPRLPRIIAGTYLAGLAANVLKLTVSRARPNRISLNLSVLDTFQGWFPLLSAGSAGQGFPSGHTATAAGLAVGLTWLFPRGKWLFASFAVLAALQRVSSGYHFPSDVCWGAALGWTVAAACLPGGLFSKFFDQFEALFSGSDAALIAKDRFGRAA